MRLCVIPARGGSKRIPKKNIRSFYGVPIIAYSIKAAIESNVFDRVIVSTEDEEIASIARSYGANVPFLRPSTLADDYTGTTAVIKHAIEWFELDGNKPEEILCLYATAPFISEEVIRKSMQVFLESRRDYCLSVTAYDFPIQRAVKITDDNRLEMFAPENYIKRSQDLVDAYHDAGQFYWGTSDAWKEEKILFSKHTIPFVLPSYLVQDIDTLDDWRRAELMYQSLERSTAE